MCSYLEGMSMIETVALAKEDDKVYIPPLSSFIPPLFRWYSLQSNNVWRLLKQADRSSKRTSKLLSSYSRRIRGVTMWISDERWSLESSSPMRIVVIKLLGELLSQARVLNLSAPSFLPSRLPSLPLPPLRSPPPLSLSPFPSSSYLLFLFSCTWHFKNKK